MIPVCSQAENQRPEPGVFSVNSQNTNIWGFVGPVASVVTAQFCTLLKCVHECVPIKLYLQNQVKVSLWPLGPWLVDQSAHLPFLRWLLQQIQSHQPVRLPGSYFSILLMAWKTPKQLGGSRSSPVWPSFLVLHSWPHPNKGRTCSWRIFSVPGLTTIFSCVHKPLPNMASRTSPETDGSSPKLCFPPWKLGHVTRIIFKLPASCSPWFAKQGLKWLLIRKSGRLPRQLSSSPLSGSHPS